MAITTINVGTTANDGTGDTLRAAFQKTNTNFAQAINDYGTRATGVLGETFPRNANNTADTPIVSGQLYLCAIYLPIGTTVTSVTFSSAGTALTAGTSPHLWMALYDSARALLRQSTDDVAPVWGAFTLKTKALTSAVVTTYSGLYYLGLNITMTGGTLPTLQVIYPPQSSGLAPILSGYSTTGLTGTAPATGAALAADYRLPYAYAT